MDTNAPASECTVAIFEMQDRAAVIARLGEWKLERALERLDAVLGEEVAHLQERPTRAGGDLVYFFGAALGDEHRDRAREDHELHHVGLEELPEVAELRGAHRSRWSQRHGTARVDDQPGPIKFRHSSAPHPADCLPVPLPLSARRGQ